MVLSLRVMKEELNNLRREGIWFYHWGSWPASRESAAESKSWGKKTLHNSKMLWSKPHTLQWPVNKAPQRQTLLANMGCNYWSDHAQVALTKLIKSAIQCELVFQQRELRVYSMRSTTHLKKMQTVQNVKEKLPASVVV